MTMTDEKNTGTKNVQPAEDKKQSGSANTDRYAGSLSQGRSGSIDQEEGNMNNGETGNDTPASSQEG